VRPRVRVRRSELLDKIRIYRRHDRRFVKIKTERRRAGPDLVLLPEQGEVCNTTPQQDGRRLEDSIILAFGQRDPLPIGAPAP
jgi:hypothetical protein